MSSLPFVSVILPTHNRPKLLAEALASIDQQTYQGPVEIILADDASSPPVTMASIPPCRFAVRIVRNPVPLGGAAAKNLGIKAAQGDYLVFLDDDDLLHPGYIEDALTTLQNYPAIKTLFMHVQWFGERAEWGQTHHDRNVSFILKQTKHVQIGSGLFLFTEGLFSSLLQRIPMPFQRPVLRRADFETIGTYQEDCLLWDCEWALRAALHGPCALLHKSPYLQRASGQGYSSQQNRQEEHILSMLKAKETLLNHPLIQRYPTEMEQLKSSLAESWLGAAFFYCQNKPYRLALRALWRSGHYRLQIRQLKLLGKIFIYAIIHP